MFLWCGIATAGVQQRSRREEKNFDSHKSETGRKDTGRANSLDDLRKAHNPIPSSKNEKNLGEDQCYQREYQWNSTVLESFRAGSKERGRYEALRIRSSFDVGTEESELQMTSPAD